MRLAGPAPCPINLPKLKGLDISARYHPDRCGGDFFVGADDWFSSDISVVGYAGSIELMRFPRRKLPFGKEPRELFEAADANESDAIAILGP